LPLSVTSTQVYYSWARHEPTGVEPLMGLHSNGLLPALTSIIMSNSSSQHKQQIKIV